MSTVHHQDVAQRLRVRSEDVLDRQRFGKSVTVLDARNEQAWSSSPINVQGAIRVRPDDWKPSPSWPKDQWTVVY